MGCKTFISRFIQACLFLYLTLVTTRMYADDDMKFYTHLAIGDTITTYGEDGKYIARFYALVDEGACTTCMQSLANISQHLLARGDVQVVLFYRVSNPAATENFRKNYDWQGEIVADLAGAYKHLYGVDHYPLCMLTDNKGVIHFLDVPGKASFNLSLLQNALAAIFSIPKEMPATELVRIYAHPVVVNGKPLADNWMLKWGTTLIKKNKFVLWNYDEKKTYMANRNGTVESVLDIMPMAATYRMTSSLPIGGFGGNREIFFLNTNYHTPITLTLYSVEPGSEKMHSSLNLDDDTIRYPSSDALQINDTTFLIGSYPKYWATVALDTSMPTCQIVTLSGRVLADLGRYEKYAGQYPVRSYYWQAFCLGNTGNIYELSALSDTIRVYTQTGTRLQSIPCDYDSTCWNYRWREYLSPLYEGAPVEEFKKVEDSLTLVQSGGDGLLFDNVRQSVYVVYYRRTTLTSGTRKFYYFIHHPQVGGKAVRRDLSLPEEVRPLYIEDGIVYCIEGIDGILNLTAYQLPPWL